MRKEVSQLKSWYEGISQPLLYFILVVIIPTLISVIYFGFIASDIYTSEAKYAVRTNDESSISVGALGSILSPGGGDSYNEDVTIVQEYILSRGMLEMLDNRLGIRTHYQSAEIDFIARLGSDDSNEDFLNYFQDMVHVDIDASTNVTTVEVKAFDAKVAYEIANNIIELSEDLVNKISGRIIEDSLRFARNEVNQGEERVRQASAALTNFRHKTKSFDPGQETAAVFTIIAELETQLAVVKAELIEAKSFMQEGSTHVNILSNRVESLEQQINDERTRLASDETRTNYTQLIDQYEQLILEQELAKRRYESTLVTLELARTEGHRKQRYLITFVQPVVSDEATEPERFDAILISFLALCIFYGIGGLVWAAIKDHMRL